MEIETPFLENRYARLIEGGTGIRCNAAHDEPGIAGGLILNFEPGDEAGQFLEVAIPIFSVASPESAVRAIGNGNGILWSILCGDDNLAAVFALDALGNRSVRGEGGSGRADQQISGMASGHDFSP